LDEDDAVVVVAVADDDDGDEGDEGDGDLYLTHCHHE
jgi:hypothetical protein